MSRNFSVHCEHCQSFPDGYYCSCDSTFHKDKEGNYLVARECWYEAFYSPEWTFHPCPYFEGEIRFHQDKKGNWYDKNHYARIQILYPDAEFTEEQLVEVHY